MADKWLSAIFAGYKQHAGGRWAKNLKVIDWDELHEAKHISPVYLQDLPSDQVWPQMKGEDFIFPSINGDLCQPGLRATEMSRRAVRRNRKQREKEKEEEEKNKLEDKQQAEKEVKQKQRDIQMKEEDFWTVNSSLYAFLRSIRIAGKQLVCILTWYSHSWEATCMHFLMVFA